MRRRSFVLAGLSGIGAVGVGGVSVGATPTPASGDLAVDSIVPVRPRSEVTADLERLVYPAMPGALVSGSQVVDIFADEFGCGVVLFRAPDGSGFRADIYRRGVMPASSFATTERYELNVRNDGDGRIRTSREIESAMLALTAAVRENESALPRLELVTRSEFRRVLRMLPG